MITLDAHGQQLLSQYRERRPLFERLEQLAYVQLQQALRQQGIYVTAIEHRVKEEKSLAGKLELKGAKYHSLDDITDILGLRVITFYTDDVDKVGAIVKKLFDVDWQESVDKRKQHSLNSFGYNSLHFICRLRNCSAENMPQVSAAEEEKLKTLRFEVQMRTALQHVWSTIEHDTGYKGVIQLPPEYRRQFSRLAGMLELVDDEFGRLRTNLTDYRRRIQSLVASGQLDEVPLNVDNFRSFLETKPFDRLNRRIAAVNQAEIIPSPLMPFFYVLQEMGMETLGDIQRFLIDNSENAYQLALSQLALTDLDILAESIGIQNLCFVHVLKSGGGVEGVKKVLDRLNFDRQGNLIYAQSVYQQALSLPFMQKGEG